MKKLSLLFLIVICQCFADAPIPKWQPGTLLHFSYFAFTCPPTNGPTGPCAALVQKTPLPNAWVTLFVTPTTGSGFHSHESTQTNRPTTAFVTPARVLTGPDGYAHWHIVASPWSGEYNVVIIPESPYPLVLPTYTTKFYVGVTVDDKNGNPHEFSKFKPGGAMASSAPTDVRHMDAAGNAFYNTWGPDSCMKSLQVGAYNYYFSIYNAGRYRLAPWRISLPDGGKSDNEIDANGSYLFSGLQGQWQGRMAEWHPSGVAVDIVNPKLYADPAPVSQLVQFDGAMAVLYKAGWRMGKTDQYGDTLGDKNAISLYWFNQPMVHLVCQSEPMLPQ